MNYGDCKVTVRGIKYRIDQEPDGVYATNEDGEKKKISDRHELTKDASELMVTVRGLLKNLIKHAWHLKPFRETKI
jgi:ribosomal protein L6P/L9E